MTIGEFSEMTGISAYTLRYYEKKGLLRVSRDSAGRRDYRTDDIEWVKFIQRLKDTGMLLRDIKHYSDLRYQGDSTMAERMKLLTRHRESVVEEKRRWEEYLRNLDEKIGIYRERSTMQQEEAVQKSAREDSCGVTIFQKNEITEPALFTPFDTTKAVEDFPEVCVSTFSEKIVQKFASLRNVKKIAELYTANGAIPVYKIHYKDRDIAFYLSRVGAPACVAGFEEVIAMGAKKFVLFGSCGVLDDDKVKENIIIPVSAIRDEGTSYHYMAPSEEMKAKEHSVQILEKVLKSCGYSYVKGKTWTSDAIYRETLPVIHERRKEGCLAVEMECASMLAVSQYRKIPFIQFLYGADNLSSDKWEIRDLESYGFTNAEKYMLLAFECGLSMS